MKNTWIPVTRRAHFTRDSSSSRPWFCKLWLLSLTVKTRRYRFKLEHVAIPPGSSRVATGILRQDDAIIYKSSKTLKDISQIAKRLMVFLMSRNIFQTVVEHTYFFLLNWLGTYLFARGSWHVWWKQRKKCVLELVIIMLLRYHHICSSQPVICL